jgi:hypothetical protein
MINPESIPDVEPEELLARYILQRSYIRSDQSLRPNAFIPHPHLDLSVTRHRQATVDEIWACGNDVAAECGKTLYGRADFTAAAALKQYLSVVAARLDNNPNHANISGWPPDKPSQKMIALELAAAATFVPTEC